MHPFGHGGVVIPRSSVSVYRQWSWRTSPGTPHAVLSMPGLAEKESWLVIGACAGYRSHKRRCRSGQLAVASTTGPRLEFCRDLEGTTRKVSLLSTPLAWKQALAWANEETVAIWHRNFWGLHQVAGLLISLACLVISVFLVLCYLRPWRRREVPYQSIVWMIAGFLLLCGLSNSLDVFAQNQNNSLTGLISVAMAAASWTAVLNLACLVRVTRAPCHPREFDKEIAERQRAEEALKKSESTARKLALVASRTDNAVIITDDDVCIEWVNDGFTRITGYVLEEALGRRPGALLQGPETDPKVVAMMRERIGAGLGFQCELVNYGKTGAKYWAAIEVQPIRDESGRLTNFMAVESDITERKRAERRMEVQHATMQVLAGCSRLDEAIPSLLSTIGRLLDFDVAECWMVDRQAGVLRAEAEPWTSQRVGPEWARAMMGLQFSRGAGLAGRVWSTGCSAWVDDLTREPGVLLVRQELALRLGLAARSAFRSSPARRGRSWV